MRDGGSVLVLGPRERSRVGEFVQGPKSNHHQRHVLPIRELQPTITLVQQPPHPRTRKPRHPRTLQPRTHLHLPPPPNPPPMPQTHLGQRPHHPHPRKSRITAELAQPVGQFSASSLRSRHSGVRPQVAIQELSMYSKLGSANTSSIRAKAASEQKPESRIRDCTRCIE